MPLLRIWNGFCFCIGMELSKKNHWNRKWLWIVGAIALAWILTVISRTQTTKPDKPTKDFQQMIRDGDI